MSVNQAIKRKVDLFWERVKQNQTLIFYHGSKPNYLRRILNDRILKPRKETNNSNSEDSMKSFDEFVYLTLTGAIGYGTLYNKYGKRILIIETEVSDINSLYPDEDWLLRHLSCDRNAEGDRQTKDRWKQNSFTEFRQYQNKWEECLKECGNLCTDGVVKACRYILIPYNEVIEYAFGINDIYHGIDQERGKEQLFDLENLFEYGFKGAVERSFAPHRYVSFYSDSYHKKDNKYQSAW